MPRLDHPYLRPADLRRLRYLMFAPRRPVEGLYAGRHVSPQRGHSVEFVDYRQYMPGDEVADIDWKVYGRSDRLFVRLFEHQSDMTVHLMLDASASMDYPKNEAREPALMTKFDHAARLTAAIAFLVSQQHDKVSLSIASEGLDHFERPGRSVNHLINILNAMQQAPKRGEARLAAALGDVAARTGRRGLLVLVSDLLDEPDPILSALSRFQQRGGEVIVFHVLHEHELALPSLDAAVFTDAETGRRLALNINDVRRAYEARLRRFLDGWAAAFKGRGIDYQLVPTTTDYTLALQRYLFTRAAAS